MLHACSSDESAISDEILSARARDGARSAFAELVGRYQDRVYRIALRMSHNPSDAEEIAQETFLLAHRGIATFHGESLFRTWLYRIAVDQALMRRRAAKRRPVQSLELLTPWASTRRYRPRAASRRKVPTIWRIERCWRIACTRRWPSSTSRNVPRS